MAIEEVSAGELANGVEVLIDVREVDEYTAGHVPGAINVPLSELVDRVHDCLLGPVVHVVCAAGGRSLRACEFLSAHPDGHATSFVNVAGGTNAWVLEGHEVVAGDSPR